MSIGLAGPSMLPMQVIDQYYPSFSRQLTAALQDSLIGIGDWHVLLPCEGCLVERNDSTPRACGLDVRGGLDAVPSALAVMTAWFREEGLSEAKWPPAVSIGGPLQIAPSSSVVGTCAPDQSMLMQQPNGAFLTSLSRRLHESPYKLSPSLPRETPSGLAAGSPPYSGSRTSHPCRFEPVPFSESGHLRSEISYRAEGSTTFVHPPLSACLSGVGLKTNLEGVR